MVITFLHFLKEKPPYYKTKLQSFPSLFLCILTQFMSRNTLEFSCEIHKKGQLKIKFNGNLLILKPFIALGHHCDKTIKNA